MFANCPTLAMRCSLSSADITRNSGLCKSALLYFNSSPFKSQTMLVAVAVELLSPKGFGRCRLQIIPNAETKTLKAFIQKHIKPGSTIYTDGLVSYPSATKDDYIHQGTSIKGSGKEANEVLPGVHRVAALVKRYQARRPRP